ncbi:TrbC/VirB2 family protein [Acidithiobacillus caldus]|uniref:TrbC/VirB2 family protein n=1 Tax=Acidithiobacillus caldus TaxID=33059 RepID=UPI001C07DD78|nr:TrbC/VirB2 family protein [Acidithiobacillus caldus]MBU2791514.1 conjugal transfer protein TrbC [Acidithiobacillus caldus]
MKKWKLKEGMKKALGGLALALSPAVALASTSGGVFSPISGRLNTVLTGVQDFGGLVAAGGLVATGLAWWHGGEHKKAMMIGLGATVAGIVLANAKPLATSLTGGATMGHVGTLSLVAGHALHLIGL